MTGTRAIKILEWCYFNLVSIAEEDLTTFEKQLFDRIKLDFAEVEEPKEKEAEDA